MITTLRCSGCKATVAIDLADERLDPVEIHRCASRAPPAIEMRHPRPRPIPHAPPLGDLDWLRCEVCAFVLRREWSPSGYTVPFHLREDTDPESPDTYITCEAYGRPA